MSTQLKPSEPSIKPVFAGIDVGAEELILVIRKDGVPRKAQTFANTAVDRAHLAKKLAKLYRGSSSAWRPLGFIIWIYPLPCTMLG